MAGRSIRRKDRDKRFGVDADSYVLQKQNNQIIWGYDWNGNRKEYFSTFPSIHKEIYQFLSELRKSIC